MTRWWPARVLVALVSGLALALAFPSFNLPVLAWVSVAGVLVAMLGAPMRQAALCGFLHGVAFYTATLPWVYTVMRVHGGVAVLPAAGVLALMVAVLALFPAAFALGVAWIARSGVGRACLAAPFLWVALEYARTHLPALGFPWDLLGYAASGNLALLQIVTVTGIYGLSFLLAAYNALVAWAVRPREPHSGRRVVILLGATAVLLVAGLVGGRLVPKDEPSANPIAHMVQTNFPQSISYPPDWMERHAAELDELERLSVSAGQRSPGLVIWPEVPAPFSFQDLRFTARAERIARASQSNFLVGVVDWKPRPAPREAIADMSWAPYNSAALLDASGRRLFLYDKIHLVPFGEYVPARRRLAFAGKLTAEIGDFQPGSAYKVGELPGNSADRGRTFAVFICYEAIFPDEVGRFVANGAELLINLSNDGWFGRSSAPAQHLMMARVRAVENRRWLLRATNNGLTVSVDPYGRYKAELAPDVRAVFDAPYNFRGDRTLYTRWGDWLAWLCLLASAYFLFVGALPAAPHRRRKKA